MESLTYHRVMTEDLQFGTGAREVRLQDSRVVTMQDFDPGVEWAYRTGNLPDYVGKGRNTLVARPTAITRAITIPRDETLIIPAGGSLNLQATVTCYGRIIADKNQIFTGSGSITFPEGATVQAEWWGAKGDGVTDCATAIQTALNAHTSKMDVRLGEGTFLLGSTVTTPTGANLDWRICGHGQRKTILKRTNGFTGTMLLIGTAGSATNRYYLEQLEIDGIDKASGTCGIRAIRGGQSHFREVYVHNCEKGIWISGGSYHLLDNCYVEQNTAGAIMDNTGGLPFTFARIEACIFRHNQTSLDINAKASATNLVRNISLYRTSFENDQLSSGTDIGLRIREAEQVHCHECWFEDNSYHVHIDGSNAVPPEVPIRVAQYLSWVGCNFGNQNAAAVAPEVFLFTGTATNDGRGCFLQACRTTEGEFQFDQDVRVAIRDMEPMGTTSFTGNSWYQELSTDSESHSYTELSSKVNWCARQVLKDDGNAQYRMREILATGRTTDATPTSIGEFVPAFDSSIAVSARVLARKSDNTDQATWHVAALFQDVENPPDTHDITQIDDPAVTEHDTLESGGAATWAFDIDTTGSSIRYMATGQAATDIDWQVWVTILQTKAS